MVSNFKIMNVGVIGLGFVGLSMSCVIAHKGFSVFGVDNNSEKLLIINKSKSPFFEPKINELLNGVLGKSLIVNSDLNQCLKESEIIFVCVGTPSNFDGSSNLTHLENTCMAITKFLNKLNDEKFRIIVIKSTMPQQTIETKIIPLFEKNCIKKIGIDFGICVNPEFLKEGDAVADFL